MGNPCPVRYHGLVGESNPPHPDILVAQMAWYEYLKDAGVLGAIAETTEVTTLLTQAKRLYPELWEAFKAMRVLQNKPWEI